MSYPDSIADRTVIIGGGVHGATYASTYYSITGNMPVVLEKGSSLGGIFSRVIPFYMNSVNNAAIESTQRGPSRIPSTGACDSLNWIPNGRFQVTSTSEYPSTEQMSYAVQKSLTYAAETHTNAEVTFADDLAVYAKNDDSRFLGYAKRIVYAGGLSMPVNPEYSACPAIVTAEAFLKDGYNDKYNRKFRTPIAVIGGGDTAVTVIEYLLGMGQSTPYDGGPTDIRWYGGPTLPDTKKRWVKEYHARYLGIARHLPQAGVTGVLKPEAYRVTPVPMGDYASVRGRAFNLVIDATGFKPTPPPCGFSISNMIRDRNDGPIARYAGLNPLITAVGPCAELNTPDPYFPSSYPASKDAIYTAAPRTAALAAIHALNDQNGEENIF